MKIIKFLKDKRFDELTFRYQQLEEEFIKLKKKHDIKIKNYLPQIEELEQNKVYFISTSNKDFEEVSYIKEEFNSIFKHLKWSPPNFVIINRDISKIRYEELKELKLEIELELNKRSKIKK